MEFHQTVVKFLLKTRTVNPMVELMENKQRGISKVIMIHPLGTMNICAKIS